MLGPPQLNPQINAELAKNYIQPLPDQIITLKAFSSVSKAMNLDSFQLIKSLLQENCLSF
jgi:hypothetical protein